MNAEMKVVLIFPGISGIGFNSYGTGLDTSWISHGLCSISAYAKNKGFHIELIDLRCLRSWNDFRRSIARLKPDVIGMTIMSVDYNPALKSLRIIKEVSPRTITVVGGPHPSIETGEVESVKDIDHIITSEGEISFTQLLEDIRDGRHPPRIIRGVAAANLDELPFVDRELFRNHEHPLPAEGFKRPFVTIIAGRGCRYNCNFCQPAERTIFGAKVRRRSPANIIQELDMLRDKYSFNSILFHDDCITEDRPWVMEFCRLYKEKGFNRPFACQSRADIICANEDMVALMAESGMKLMFIGFESGNQRVLNFLRKGTKVEHNYRAAEICRTHGIHIWSNYMLGIPTETKQEVMDTVTMLRRINPEHYSPAFYTPHPGSDLFTYCQEQGISLIRSHDSYRRNPIEAKIKGLDYDFLYQALRESMGMRPLWRNRFLLGLERRAYFFCHRHRPVRYFMGRLLNLFQRNSQL